MKKILRETKKVLIILVGSMIIICYSFYSIVLASGPGYEDTYMKALQDKYDLLVKNKENRKIVVLGGSSSAFGLTQKEMSRSLEMPVVNMSLHAGLNGKHQMELAEKYTIDGDIVLLALEYDYSQSEDYFKTYNAELMMNAFDNRWDMYKDLPITAIGPILGYLPTFTFQKKNRYKNSTGIYAASSFDAEGDMIYPRPETFIYDEDGSVPSSATPVNFADFKYDEGAMMYLAGYKKKMNSKGVKVYFVNPPLFDKILNGTPEEANTFNKQIEELTGIPYITNAADYIFSETLMYDTVYHCNDEGQRVRTEMLIQDIKESGILEDK